MACPPKMFFLFFILLSITNAIENREGIEIMLEEVEEELFELEHEIQLKKQAEMGDSLDYYSLIAIDSGGMKLSELENILASEGFIITAKHPILPNIFQAARVRRTREKRQTIYSLSQLEWIEPLNVLSVQKRGKFNVNDPHFDKQLNQLSSVGIPDAWALGLSGKGVSIGIVDDGINFGASPELSSTNYSTVSVVSMGTESSDAEVYVHGTQCAGIISMKANNSECGVGGSPGAHIIDIPLLSTSVTDYSESVAMAQSADVFSCSWGPPDDGKNVEGPLKLTKEVLQKNALHGRNGRGSIFIWASGNGGQNGDDCALDGFVSNNNTIAIGAVKHTGGRPKESEGCSSILTSIMVDNSGGLVSVGANGKCVSSFQGSSAAAPLAAAAIALVLEKYPKLTRRELLHLLVRTSSRKDIQDTSATWTENAVGLQFNRYYGFGLLSVTEILSEAPYIMGHVSESQHCSMTFSATENNGLFGEMLATLPVTNCQSIKFLEHVQLRVKIEHPRRGDIKIMLTSPQGTAVNVLTARNLDSSSSGLVWTFSIVHFWGENPSGIWTVKFSDEKDLKRGRVVMLGLELSGTQNDAWEGHVFNSQRTKVTDWLLPLLILVVIGLVLYGGFEYLRLVRKKHRTASSLRILDENYEP